MHPSGLGRLADVLRGFIPCEQRQAERDCKDWRAASPFHGRRNSRAPMKEGFTGM